MNKQKTKLIVFDGITWLTVGRYDTKTEAIEESKWYKKKGMETYMEKIK